ncbi:MAG: hypothetical protein IJQ66_06545 [Clostridia bacterium]|nr:hypothetical protein [Clostridia bacterium]
MKGENKTFKKVMSVILDVIVYAFIILGLFTVTLTVISKRDDDGAVNVFGMQMRIVISSSMEKYDGTDVSAYRIKDIPIKSMVFIELVPEDEKAAEKWYSELQVGDVLTFRYKYDTQETITHRIVKIKPKASGGYIISLEGDNKASDAKTLKQTIDTSLADTSPNYIIGKVTGQSRILGFLVYSLKQPLVILFLIVVPCVVIIVFQIIKIVNILTADKKKRFAEEKQKMAKDKEKQASEIEELKKQLAALQKQVTADGDMSDATDSDVGKAEETGVKTEETGEI